jgi:16S rRNA (uracil1498-N3)-methyltransferase
MPDRFYYPDDLHVASLTLDGREGHHLARVLRKRPGDDVELFDGRGGWARARIESVAKDSAELQILETGEDPPSPYGSLELVTAVPKGDRFRWLIEKAVELGVDRLTPLTTERSVVDPGATKLDKMRQVVVEACKQCGRNRLMGVADTDSLDQVLARNDESILLVADPAGDAAHGVRDELDSERDRTIVVGPEGGLTESELEQLVAAGARRVNLGRHTLRIETAAVAAASWLAFD